MPVVAPVALMGSHPANLLTPRADVLLVAHRVMLLDMTSIGLDRIAQVDEAGVDAQAVSDGLDAIFTGFIVGLPSLPLRTG